MEDNKQNTIEDSVEEIKKEVEIDNKLYNEMKISYLVIDGHHQESSLISAEQLVGKSRLRISIKAEPLRKFDDSKKDNTVETVNNEEENL